MQLVVVQEGPSTVQDEEVPSNTGSAMHVEEPAIIKNLRSWVVRNHIPLNHVDDLLSVLNTSGVKNLPQCSKTLMQISNCVLDITPVAPGENLHFGIKKYLQSKNFEFLKNNDCVELSIGIDGLKLFKSSRRELWPIIGAFSDHIEHPPFLIGCYAGMRKPCFNDEFLKQFIDEITMLKRTPIRISRL